jgi:hypothetical protein
MNNKILGLVLILSLILNVILGLGYYQNLKKNSLADVGGAEMAKDQRIKIADFSKFFINKIVATGGEINFEDRNKIEQDLKELNNENISANWTNFISSKDSAETQKSVIGLMIALTDAMVE